MSRVTPPPRTPYGCRYWCPSDGCYADFRISTTYSSILVDEPCIGLTDCHGTAIYEGDILRFDICGVTHGPEPESGIVGAVWYCEEDACWAIGRWEAGTSREWWYTFSDRIDRKTLTVVGNVHQHSHLLAP